MNIQIFGLDRSSFCIIFCSKRLLPIIIRSKLIMYSFNSTANSPYSAPEGANPEAPLAAFSKQSQLRQEPLSQNNNDILTPNFNDFPSSIGNENLFDAYHQQFAERSNNLSKLISTFEGLGLDIEYLEESDEQCAESSQEQHFPRPQLAKVLPIDEQLDRAEPMNNTVSRSSKPSFSKRQRQHLDSLKLNCKSMRTQLASFLQSLQSFQKQIKNIFVSAHGYFTKFLNRYYQAVAASFSSCAKCKNLQGDCQYLERDNVYLYKIVAEREEVIKALLKEKDQLIEQNERLHCELEVFSMKHKGCQNLTKENEELQRLLVASEAKSNSLELQVNDLTSRAGQLRRRIKDLQKQSQINNSQHQKVNEGLEKKYEKMFNQTVEEMTRKIEAEAYYRAKHQYPLKEFHYRGAEPQEKMSKSSHYGNTLQPLLRSQNYQSTVPSQKQLAIKRTNSESRQSISFYREDSCYSSNLSPSIVDDQRKVDRILEDIRKMKNSRDPSSMPSSCRYIEPTRKSSYPFK